MSRRPGASLLNVMVFMMFAVMITAQVFFFAKWSADSVAEEREIMMYRLNLDSLVETGKNKLMNTASGKIEHLTDLENASLKFSDFYENTIAFSNVLKYGSQDIYHLTIHDLDYVFNPEFQTITRNDRKIWTEQYSDEYMYRKVFAAMLPLGVVSQELAADGVSSQDVNNAIGKPVYTKIYNRFYLIRAWAELPAGFYGRKLMYQVLVSRDENTHNVQVLSFQEVWF